MGSMSLWTSWMIGDLCFSGIFPGFILSLQWGRKGSGDLATKWCWHHFLSSLFFSSDWQVFMGRTLISSFLFHFIIHRPTFLITPSDVIQRLRKAFFLFLLSSKSTWAWLTVPYTIRTLHLYCKRYKISYWKGVCFFNYTYLVQAVLKKS